MSRFPPDLFAGSRFAVVGLGRNGLPVARALLAMGAEVIAWDDNESARSSSGAAFAAPAFPASGRGAQNRLSRSAGDIGPTQAWPDEGVHLEIREPAPQDRLDALILSPGIPHCLPAPHRLARRAREAGWPILSDAELLYRAVRKSGSRARLAGITGTNGKSTTTALLAHMLSEAGIPNAAGGNLGTPALALPLLPDGGVYALEMSSYMLERIATLRFDAAAMLNLSPDHLDRHGDLARYLAAKRAIFAGQQVGDLAVVGTDDEPSRLTAAWLATRPARVVTVSETGPPLADAPALPGPHNVQNAAAAAAMARHFGAPDAAIARALASFPGLPHRQQMLGRAGGIAFVNDSKATNADSAARALACYPRVVWIAGGIAKEGGIAPLAPLFPRVAHAVLIGRDAPLLAATLAAHGVSHEVVGTLERAVPAALAAARRSGVPVVLLSPACASFDQFSGFDARGDRFAALVAALPCERAA
ncbi:MAG TPA: UDP-N-acetylmuramoyl-L-alanine--D-glutamate ligase [Acetobacteraceae bacterium]|nr:UDP-N-acetylmuramoyl-L-alanine--D-glutamate ligase [Acetobacteraceae bacterium]